MGFCNCAAGEGHWSVDNYTVMFLALGGYFIIHGVERIILIQEQLSKNRIIVEEDHHGVISASVHSATDVKRSKTHVVYTKAKHIVLRNNSLNGDVDVCVVMKVGVVLSNDGDGAC